MAKYSFRVEIEVNADTSPTDPTIGLTSGKFIWIAGDSFNYSSSLKGILSEDFADSITKSIQVDRMGDVANIDGLNLKIKNTSKFWVQFITAFGENASLHGSKVTIYEMVDNGLGGSTSTILYVGYCDLPSFDKSTYKIPVRGSGDVRTAYLTKPITNDFLVYDNVSLGINQSYVEDDAIGKTLPITFGEHGKAYFLKTGDRETLGETTTNFGVHNSFPVVSKYDSYSYDIKIARDDTTSISNTITGLINYGSCFLKVIEGTGSSEVSLITDYTFLAFNVLRVTLDHPFSVEDGLVADDSIVQFVEVIKQYNGDFWQCGGFYKDGNKVTYNQDIFAFNSGFNLIPSNSIQADIYNSKENTLVDSPKFYEDDNLIGFEIIQDKRATKVFADQANYWFDSSWVYFSPLGCLVPSGSINNGSYTINTDTAGNTTTNDWSEPAIWDVDLNLGIGGINRDFIKAYEIEVPDDIPSSFDSAHLVLTFDFDSTADANIDFNIVKKRWWESSNTELYRKNIFLNGSNSFSFDNFPFNYDSEILSRYFWAAEDQVIGSSPAIFKYSGYIRTDLQVNSREELEAVKTLLFYMKFEGSVGSQNIQINVKSAGFCFKKSSDTSKGVYTEFKGRLWDSNVYPTLGWTTSELINSPIEAMAHARLLQNYSNDGVAAPSGGWGTDYNGEATTTLLNLSQNTTGSFYHLDFSSFGWNDCEISKQVTDSKDSTTKSLCKNICNQFFLASWVNNTGLECVGQIAQKSSLTISETITQAQMIKWGSRREQDSRNIFVEPSVSWGYNSITKTFKGTISITNVSSNLTLESDKADAVKGLEGFSDSYKAMLWDMCKALYKYYGVINEAPKILSEQTWIGKITDADWYLRKWLRFMGVGIVDGVAKVVPKTYFDFSVPYEVGRLWDIGTRINVKVPNITDNSPYEAFIYSIKKNIANKMPSIDVKVILFDQDTIEEFDIQDSYDSTLDTWQDSTNSGETNIQDEV
jgi:hypothetical protein